MLDVVDWPSIEITNEPKKSPNEIEIETKKNKKIEYIWATKLPWERNVLNVDGFVTHVRCKICTKLSRNIKFLEPSKYDYLCNHDGRKKKQAPCLH
jgi:hypothetical protein